MKGIQFINITPEDQKESILLGVQSLFEEFKKDFQPKQPEEYLTREETADLLKVDVNTIYNWTKRGVLQKYGISGRVYYKRSEIEATIAPIK